MTIRTVVGYTTNLYINRHLAGRWEVGAMPFALFTFIPDYNYTIVGLNLTARLYLFNWKTVRPYAYGNSRFRTNYLCFDDSQNSTSDKITFSNTSLGVGNKVLIGNKGWSLDVNFATRVILRSLKNLISTTLFFHLACKSGLEKSESEIFLS